MTIPVFTASSLGCSGLLPAPESNYGPDCLHQPERPRTLKKSIYRAQRAGNRKGKDEPRTTLLQGIKNEHGGYGQQSESRELVHSQIKCAASPPRGERSCSRC